MSGYTKTIFIGSSSEALPIVDKVESLLKDSYNVLRWDKSFTTNKSTLDCLVENAIKVDEAIFIGTADDKVQAFDEKRYAKEGELRKHRDNVVFEFGLFLGMLGRKDCIYLIDDKSDIMTDYNGVTTIFFDKNNIDTSLPVAIDKIHAHFEGYSNRDINLFPSTFLASAYFVNFINPIFIHYLNKKHRIITDKGRYKECEITIILPSRLSDNLNAQVDALKGKINTRSEKIEYLGRSRQLLVDVSSSRNKLKIIDFPTILVSLRHAVHAMLPDEKNKCQPCYDLILEREVNRFIEALKLYIHESSEPIPVTIMKEDDIIASIPAKRAKKIFRIFFSGRS